MLFKLSFAVLLAVASINANELLYERDLPPAIAVNADSYIDCANAAWPPSKVGRELIPQKPSRELREMLSDIDPTNIQRNIRKLVSFGTRHTLSVGISNETWGIGAARDWTYSDFQKYEKRSGGRLIAGIEQGIANRVPFPTNFSNVLATIKGSEDNGRVYVITGHYDTRVTDVLNYKADAPPAQTTTEAALPVSSIFSFLESLPAPDWPTQWLWN